MNILNFGNCIKNGDYKLHSKFKSVHNYINNKQLVSLVSTKVGSGPNNIVLNNFPQQANKTLSVSNSKILIGENSLHFIPQDHHHYEVIFINNISDLLSQVKLLSDEIADKISHQSLGFLLFPKNEIYFQTTFEKAFLNHVKNTCRSISLKNLPTISKNMKGVGFGLTPSGDDFNCGILYALKYLKEIKNNNFSEIIEECYLNSLGNNLISNTFLKYAYSNKYYENFYNLLKALKQNEIKTISHYANKIIGSGHTSGSDMLTGFIVTFKGVLDDKKFS